MFYIMEIELVFGGRMYMNIQLATSNDLEWINNQYDSIGFVRSDLKEIKLQSLHTTTSMQVWDD